MIIKYRLISGEDEKFSRDIEIMSDSTFWDLHLAIQSACNYDTGLLTTFFLSNESWDEVQEIIYEKIDEESQSNMLLMKETKLEAFLPEIGQRYIYVFDFFSERVFFIEIVNIREPEKEDLKLQFPICTLSKGKAPQQIFVDDISDEDFLEEEEEEVYEDDYGCEFENIDDYDF